MTTDETQRWLERFIAEQGGVAGTVHARRGDLLEQVAAVNIPEPVQAKAARIPRGKGMAGLAWQRRQPVTTCNLKTDETGAVRPGAKAVGAAAAAAIPVGDAEGEVRAVVGIAYAEERDLGPAELRALSEAAASVPLP